MNRRSEKLDKFIGWMVTITFFDGDVKSGILEYGKPLARGLPPSDYYSFALEDLYFRKSHVKKIEGIMPWK